MFPRRQAQRLEIDVAARGLTVAWECAPGVIVRRTFVSATAGCAASEALRSTRPKTIEETILLLDRIAREGATSHPGARTGPSARAGRPDLHRRT